MAVPQEHGVHVVCCEHVEIFYPQLLVVEPREVLWCVRIFVNFVPWQVDCLLKAHACSAYFHFGCVNDDCGYFQVAVELIILEQSVSAIYGTRRVVADDVYCLAFSLYCESFLRQVGRIFGHTDFNLVSLLH